MLESASIQSATVSGFGEEENMCQLSLEWSEATVSCDGDVSYTVTVTPCLSGPGDCGVINGIPVSTFTTTNTQQIFMVDGKIGLEYSSNLTTTTCDGSIKGNINSKPVNLQGSWHCACVFHYLFLYS